MRRAVRLSKRSSAALGGSPEVLGGEPFKLGAKIESYRFRLYIAGNNKKSQMAIDSLRQLSALFAPGRFSAEIIDLYQNVEVAKKDNVLAVPALVKIHPPPPTTFIGAAKDHFTILRRLGIPYDPAVISANPHRGSQS
jgi:circadian clock protein KaiB